MKHCYLRFEKRLLLWSAMHNSAFQPTSLPPLRVVRVAAEGGRYAAWTSPHSRADADGIIAACSNYSRMSFA